MAQIVPFYFSYCFTVYLKIIWCLNIPFKNLGSVTVQIQEQNIHFRFLMNVKYENLKINRLIKKKNLLLNI